MTSLFGEYSTDTVIRKSVPAANSQRSESLNSVEGSKNPKIRYYGGSESNDFRVSCGVSQINLSYAYIPHTLEAPNIDQFCSKKSISAAKKEHFPLGFDKTKIHHNLSTFETIDWANKRG